jgi:uncharacterized membrane protein YcjF (UPF0283 family)
MKKICITATILILFVTGIRTEEIRQNNVRNLLPTPTPGFRIGMGLSLEQQLKAREQQKAEELKKHEFDLVPLDRYHPKALDAYLSQHPDDVAAQKEKAEANKIVWWKVVIIGLGVVFGLAVILCAPTVILLVIWGLFQKEFHEWLWYVAAAAFVIWGVHVGLH